MPGSVTRGRGAALSIANKTLEQIKRDAEKYTAGMTPKGPIAQPLGSPPGSLVSIERLIPTEIGTDCAYRLKNYWMFAVVGQEPEGYWAIVMEDHFKRPGVHLVAPEFDHTTDLLISRHVAPDCNALMDQFLLGAESTHKPLVSVARAMQQHGNKVFVQNQVIPVARERGKQRIFANADRHITAPRIAGFEPLESDSDWHCWTLPVPERS